MSPLDQKSQQREHYNSFYGTGASDYIGSVNPVVRYVTYWRITEAMKRLSAAAAGRIDVNTPILVACAGEGGEASALCDMGYKDVTMSDLSESGVKAALQRDPRLKGLVLDAQRADLADRSFGVVLIQDGLHHLPSPVQGFTEMLRLASVGVVFLEPHESLVGRLIGTRWERNGDAVNYVFRWTRKLVEDVASSYLGPDSFRNLSFSFWHHNPSFDSLGRKFGGGALGLSVIKGVKTLLDGLASRAGNQFCGLVLLQAGDAKTKHE